MLASTNNMKRIIGIDIFRGLAIVLMVIFHFCYDLNYFKFANIPLYSSDFWLNFRLVIVNMFLITAGMTLAIVHRNGIKLSSIKKRILILGGTSLLISIVTFFIFPYSWVYFGVIHFIFISSIIGLLFLRLPIISLFLSIAILIAYLFFNFNMHPIFNKIAPILHLPMRHTEDLVPFIPWFSATLLGIAIVGLNWHTKIFKNKLFEADTIIHKFLAYIGQRALLIYLLHQAILFAIFYIVWKVLK